MQMVPPRSQWLSVFLSGEVGRNSAVICRALGSEMVVLDFSRALKDTLISKRRRRCRGRSCRCRRYLAQSVGFVKSGPQRCAPEVCATSALSDERPVVLI